MGVYKTVKGVGKNKSRLYNLLQYVDKVRKGEETLTTGVNCADDFKRAYKNMLTTKELHNNTDGRQYRHHIQSFKPGEITKEKAHQIGVEFAKENFKGFEVFVATHSDKGHIHNHFIINTVHMENGRKLRELNKTEWEEKQKQGEKLEEHEFYIENLMKKNDEICKKYGLSVIERKENKQSLNIYNNKEYKILEKHKAGEERSYKLELGFKVREIAERSKSREEFKEEFKKHGIDVVWEDNLKNVTFKFEDKKKKSIRLSNLQKTYNVEEFTKDGLTKIFEENKQKEQGLEAINKQLQEQLKAKEVMTVQAGAGAGEEKNIDEEYRKIEERFKKQEEQKQEKIRIERNSKDKDRGLGR